MSVVVSSPDLKLLAVLRTRGPRARRKRKDYRSNFDVRIAASRVDVAPMPSPLG